ncbi:MAG: hypothetical protein ACYSUX_10660 [Planctomycetota bacterium]
MPINIIQNSTSIRKNLRETYPATYYPGLQAALLRAPLKIHFGEQTNLFDSGLRQEKAALASAKADFPSLPEFKNLLLVAQKQLLELTLIIIVSPC